MRTNGSHLICCNSSCTITAIAFNKLMAQMEAMKVCLILNREALLRMHVILSKHTNRKQ